jgi:phosphonate transport system substrate-binding protein
MTPIKISSIQSEIADHNCRLITRYLSEQLSVPIEFIDDVSWQDREKLFDRGEIHVCWMCSLPYIWKADQATSPVELLAAPVMQSARYQNQPVHFSDVVVHRGSKFRRFGDLRGASWAYNEPHSHSGYNITRYTLAKMGLENGFFGLVTASGSHMRSLELILEGQVDASAIDTTVLDLLLTKKPEIGEQIRVIDTWGPSPIPPWVILKNLDPDLRRSMRTLLLDMHRHLQGRKILDQGLIDHFTHIDDDYYDTVRDMHRVAASVSF